MVKKDYGLYCKKDGDCKSGNCINNSCCHKMMKDSNCGKCNPKGHKWGGGWCTFCKSGTEYNSKRRKCLACKKGTQYNSKKKKC